MDCVERIVKMMFFKCRISCNRRIESFTGILKLNIQKNACFVPKKNVQKNACFVPKKNYENQRSKLIAVDWLDLIQDIKNRCVHQIIMENTRNSHLKRM